MASEQAPSKEGQIQRVFTIVRRQLAAMDCILGDLLDIARTESGTLKLTLQPTDVRQIILESVELFEIASKNHRIEVIVPDFPLLVACDTLRLQQVLSNLLSNAIKYSPKGGSVAVRATRTPSEVWIEVADTGIGLSPEQLAELFQPFRRLSEHAGIAGAGLGLSIVRRLIKAHGGQVEVSSERGSGSVFKVRIPRLPASKVDETVTARLH